MQHKEFFAAHIEDSFPLSENKAIFRKKLTLVEIQAIDDLQFWNAVFPKLLLDMGIDFDISKENIVTTENISLIKEIALAYKECPLKNKSIYWHTVEARTSKEFRRFDRLFTRLYEQIEMEHPQAAAAIKVYIHENYYPDRSEDTAGYHFETTLNQRFMHETILSLNPESDDFVSSLSQAMRHFREQGHTVDNNDNKCSYAIERKMQSNFNEELSQLQISEESRQYLSNKLSRFYRTDKRTVRYIFKTIVEMVEESEKKHREDLMLGFDELKFHPKTKITLLEGLLNSLKKITPQYDNDDFGSVLVNALYLISSYPEWQPLIVQSLESKMPTKKGNYNKEWRIDGFCRGILSAGLLDLFQKRTQSFADCQLMLLWLNNPTILDVMTTEMSEDEFVTDESVSIYLRCFMRLMKDVVGPEQDINDRDKFTTLALIAKNSCSNEHKLKEFNLANLAPQADSPFWRLEPAIRDRLLKLPNMTLGEFWCYKAQLGLLEMLFTDLKVVERVGSLGTRALWLNDILLSGDAARTLLSYLLSLNDNDYNLVIEFFVEQINQYIVDGKLKESDKHNTAVIGEIYKHARLMFPNLNMPKPESWFKDWYDSEVSSEESSSESSVEYSSSSSFSPTLYRANAKRKREEDATSVPQQKDQKEPQEEQKSKKARK